MQNAGASTKTRLPFTQRFSVPAEQDGAGAAMHVASGGSWYTHAAPPIVALLGLLGMVIGEQFGIWVQTKKLDVSHAASVCLVGERYDRPHRSEAP